MCIHCMYVYKRLHINITLNKVYKNVKNGIFVSTFDMFDKNNIFVTVKDLPCCVFT